MTISDTIAQIEALEAKATPTEWKAENLDDEQYGRITVYKNRGGRSIAMLWQDDAPVQEWNVEQWANARLIVALRNSAPSLIAYIRALEKVRDEAEQLCMIKPSVELEKALAAGDRLLGRIDGVFDAKVTIQTAVNNGCSLSIDSNAYLIADLQPRLVEQLNRIESKLNDVAAAREAAK